MTDYPTVSKIDDVRTPERSEYERYVDVWFTNGAKVRHVVDEQGRMLEQVFRADDPSTVWDDIVVERFGMSSEDIDEYVITWLDVTLDDMRSGVFESWDVSLIVGESTSSPTNVQYE